MNIAKMHGSILREKDEPRDGYEPISLWLIALAFGLIFWAGMYLSMHSGGFRADVFNSNLVAWDGAGGTTADKGPPDPMVVGKKIFTQFCVVCHQTTGQGVAGQFPPLAGSEWVMAQDWQGDNHIIKIVLNGLQGPVTVSGSPFNNAMAPWGGVLDDHQIAAVLTYVRNSWGNEASPITPEFVAKVRQDNEGRKEAWTQKELQAIPREMAPAAEPPGAEAAPSDGSAPVEGATPPALSPPKK